MANNRKGGISVATEHIFPVIKKWLYSDKEIFVREIVSNAADAVTKMKRLVSLGEAKVDESEKYRIDVTVSKNEGTLTVSDNGIGMTEEELQKYLCSIALSGALDFIQKYEGENSSESGIIGHFGLGFYSAFMASDKVEVVTQSYSDSSKTISWTCSESGEYEIEDGTRDGRGTDVIMYITKDSEEYLSYWRIKEILEKYCSFLPVEIYLHNADETDEKKKEDENKPVNDTTPLWQKKPSECTDEEYKEFYRKVFPRKHEPLFWVHINADYPLNFKGILYFPKIESEFESLEGEVKLYYNSVFVADNVKELVPEYMMILMGVLDCPDLPLNVSRSYLQNDPYVSKLCAHISKKVADRLSSMLTQDRAAYEKIWGDIRNFIEYGCLRDPKFNEKVKDSVLLATTDDKYFTFNEYLEAAKEKNENTVYYTTDRTGQAKYIEMFKTEGINVAILDTVIDSQYISMLEGVNKDVKFLRVDAGIDKALTSGEEAKEIKVVTELFKKVSGNKDLEIKYQALKDTETPALLSSIEEERRFDDMMKMYGVDTHTQAPTKGVLVINTSCPLIDTLAKKAKDKDSNAEMIAKHIYALANLSYRRLTGEEMKDFLSSSYEILGKI